MLLVFYVSIVLPYRLGMDLEDSKRIRVIGYFIDVSFLVDMILTFFSAQFDAKKHKTYNTHKSIAINYFKGWFWLDLMSILPFEFIFATFVKDSSSLASVNSSIRIARITKI